MKVIATFLLLVPFCTLADLLPEPRGRLSDRQIKEFNCAMVWQWSTSPYYVWLNVRDELSGIEWSVAAFPNVMPDTTYFSGRHKIQRLLEQDDFQIKLNSSINTNSDFSPTYAIDGLKNARELISLYTNSEIESWINSGIPAKVSAYSNKREFSEMKSFEKMAELAHALFERGYFPREIHNSGLGLGAPCQEMNEMAEEIDKLDE